jgi:DNA repair exonuclease SbcCD ATPase subunit
MLKKILIGSAIAVGLGTFVFGRDAASYLRTSCRSVRNAVKAEVPIEFEIERARNLVDQLVPEIRQCMHVIAEQQVDIEQMTAALQRKQGELGRQKDAIMALRTDLGSGKSTFTYASHKFTAGDVKRDLANRFERYKAAEEMLTADRTILAAREQTLEANREKLDGLMHAKKELEVKLEQLQARMHTVRAAEAVSQLAIDDSNLSHARKLIDDLNKQLDVKQRVLDAEVKFSGLIPVEKSIPAVPVDLDQQIDEYFGAPASAGEVAGRDGVLLTPVE